MRKFYRNLYVVLPIVFLVLWMWGVSGPNHAIYAVRGELEFRLESQLPNR
jgi:hypothetical protein